VAKINDWRKMMSENSLEQLEKRIQRMEDIHELHQLKAK